MLSRTSTAARIYRSSTPSLVRLASSSTPAKPTTPSKPTSTEQSIPSTVSPTQQSPNYPGTWSTSQISRADAYSKPRFEQTVLEYQPQPLSAMQMIAGEPVRVVNGRKAVCDGGAGPLGHPKVFINLDKPGPHPCGYCGLRYEQAPHHGHEH